MFRYAAALGQSSLLLSYSLVSKSIASPLHFLDILEPWSKPKSAKTSTGARGDAILFDTSEYKKVNFLYNLEQKVTFLESSICAPKC